MSNNISDFISSPSYSKLVEVIKIYLNRFDEDTVNCIPFFINAAEKVILRNLRMPSMEKIVVFSLEDNEQSEDGWVLMPYDYLEMKHVWTDGVTLQRVPFDQLIDRDSIMNPRGGGFQHIMEVGRPVWAITADRFYVRGVDFEQEIYMTYYADIPEISKDTETNVLLDLVPDAFVFLSVAEGFRFLMEEQKSDYWQNQGQVRLAQVMQQCEDAEFSGSPLTIQYTY